MNVTKTYFMLMVGDMERAKRFYRETFGLQVKVDSPQWSELARGDAVVALHGGGGTEPRNTELGFQVDDLEAACAAVQQGGGRVVSPPKERPGEGIRLATIEDPEKNRISLSQPTRR